MELASNVDEPIYASKKPKRVDMSEIEDPDNATIEVTLQKFDSGAHPDVSDMRTRRSDSRTSYSISRPQNWSRCSVTTPNCSTGPNWKPATRNCKTS